MKKNALLFSFIFLLNIVSLLAQKNSYVTWKIKTDVLKNGVVVATRKQEKTTFIAKNTDFETFDWKDTLFFNKKINAKKQGAKDFSNAVFRQQKFTLDRKKEEIIGLCQSSFTQYKFSNNKYRKQRAKIFSTPLKMPFIDKTEQTMSFDWDSLQIKESVTLQIPICVVRKATPKIGAIVTVYYRAALEHLNKDTPAPSSTGKILDFGHAFIGVKDLKTNKLYFLDGWPDELWEKGNQHFDWNKNVDATRTSDHHSITFNVSEKDMLVLVREIENLRTACVDYKIIDFNCTDATTELLGKIGLYTKKDQSNTVFPDSFANQLMEKLNLLRICYEFDGEKIR